MGKNRNTSKYQKKYNDQFKTTAEPTICKCPQCEKQHEMMLIWSGRGVPRKMCHECKNLDSTSEHEEYGKRRP